MYIDEEKKIYLFEEEKTAFIKEAKQVDMKYSITSACTLYSEGYTFCNDSCIVDLFSILMKKPGRSVSF